MSRAGDKPARESSNRGRRKLMRWHLAVAVFLWVVVGGVSAWGQHEHAQGAHDQHQADIKRRGAEAMGFNQDTTTHHFRLTPQGGMSQVTANAAADTASR